MLLICLCTIYRVRQGPWFIIESAVWLPQLALL